VKINIEEEALNKILLDFLKGLSDAEKWLRRSYLKCQQIGIKENYTDEEFDDFENLTSRFGRTIDFLINKVYRCIDQIELENSGTVIDVVNRAHKRGLLDSAVEIRKIKEIRNEIVHEYTSKELKKIFEDVFLQAPLVFELIERAQVYCKKFN
jgi:hypothetical protein